MRPRAIVTVDARFAEGSALADRADGVVPEEDDWSPVGSDSTPDDLAPCDWVADARSVEGYSAEAARAHSVAADSLPGEWAQDDSSAVPTEVDRCEPVAAQVDWVDCWVPNDCLVPARPADSAQAARSPVALLANSAQADYSAAERAGRGLQAAYSPQGACPDDSRVRWPERPERAWELPVLPEAPASPALLWSCLREPFSAIVAAELVLRGAV